MKKVTNFLFASMLVGGAMLAGLYISGCGKSKKSSSIVCCDSSSIDYCNCYEYKTCDSDEREVSSCPNYGNCCRDTDMSDFCTCWSLSCDETAGISSRVSGCP
jgi:hypothetical protein